MIELPSENKEFIIFIILVKLAFGAEESWGIARLRNHYFISASSSIEDNLLTFEFISKRLGQFSHLALGILTRL